jgi:hypothetical protein
MTRPQHEILGTCCLRVEGGHAIQSGPQPEGDDVVAQEEACKRTGLRQMELVMPAGTEGDRAPSRFGGIFNG